MDFILGKRNEDLYAISFWTTLGWMFVGPLVYLISFAVLYGNVYGIDSLMNGTGFSSDFMNGLIVTELVSKVLPIGLCIYVFKKMFKADFLSFKQQWVKYLLIFVVSCITLLAANYLLSWLYELLKIEGSSANQEYIEDIFASNYKPIMFIIAVIIAPFFEELIFRKFLIGYLKGKTRLNTFWIYTIPAIIFAAIHIISNPADIIFFPLYFALSLIITLAYKYSDDNLYVASGVHYFNNILSFFAV